MSKTSWTIQLEDGTHTVELDKRWAGGKRVIRVDGQIVRESKTVWLDTGSDDDFQLGSHACVLHRRTNGFTSNYDLSLDGRSVQTGLPVARLQDTPKWMWFFVVACGIIPLLTLGGAIPFLLGFGGAVACVVVGRHPTRSTRLKAVLAGGITIFAWLLLIAFVATVTGGRTLLPFSVPAWQEYRSQSGRYSILMPGKPQERTQAVDSLAGSIDMHIASYEDRSGAFLVMYADYPADLIRSEQAEAVLDGAAQGAVTNVKGRLTQQRNISLGTVPGREIEFDTQAQGAQPATRIKVRYFLTNGRLYQVMVVAQQSQGLPADTQKYLDSFKLIEN
jgi:hypothetical protein